MSDISAFDPKWIKPDFPSEWMRKGKTYNAVPYSYFRDQDMDLKKLRNKVVVGHLLRFQTPNNGSTKMPTANQLRGAETKRLKLATNAATHYGFMIVCADAHQLPNTFCVIFNSRRDYQAAYSYTALAEQVSLGDTLVFVEPDPSDDTIGDFMPILRNPRVITVIKRYKTIPTHVAITSVDPGKEYGWYNTGKSIAVAQCVLMSRGSEVPCTGSTCDRQYRNCKGCFGKNNKLLDPLVLRATVEVQDEPKYAAGVGRKAKTAVFTGFRSWRFSQLFFKNIHDIAKKTAQDINAMDIEDAIDNMVDAINDDGGWTVIGWHRQGERIELDTGETVNSTSTLGHLVYLYPTTPEVLQKETYKELLIKTPSVALAGDNNNAQGGTNPGDEGQLRTSDSQQQHQRQQPTTAT